MGSQRVGTNQVTKHFTEYSTVTGYKINTQKYLAFLYTNNEVSEREVKETILLPISTKRIKYLGINLHKEKKDLYAENCDSDERI